ncbi:hypothetical protein EDD11_009157 [Mortierella claussenii]|nr:hypothetical protein EDD11_009157 [Mortierella claussenii]
MTSSDTNQSADPSAPSTIVYTPTHQHKKRSSSTMSPPHTTPWTPSEPIYDPYSHERPIKALRQPSPSELSAKRPWSSAEQEALYVAVERYKLYGRWSEVKLRMHLDRSLQEIEQEYMRLYGELPESDDDEWTIPSQKITSAPRSYTVGHHHHHHHPATPALTTTSSTTLSARSSQETFNNQYHRPSHHSTSEQILRSPYRKPSVHQPELDDDHDDENYEITMETKQNSPISYSPSGKGSAGRGRSNSTTGLVDVKPTRTVRVWTLQQSEQLKNLIEDCFPGGYRINWVWVASQMGNTFTRKQCKNKWEIMRRRAGTEEEVALLKKGHDEFGPLWSKIQEKYLPERSQGGISIMWSLLQAREAEQQQSPSERRSTRPRGGGGGGSEHDAAAPAAPRPPGRPRKASRATSDSMRWESSSQGKDYSAASAASGKNSREFPYPFHR